MNRYASSKFWAMYDALPREVREVADKNYELLRTNPHHPSLHFKRIGNLWSVRAGIHHRALGIDVASRGTAAALKLHKSPEAFLKCWSITKTSTGSAISDVRKEFSLGLPNS